VIIGEVLMWLSVLISIGPIIDEPVDF